MKASKTLRAVVAFTSQAVCSFGSSGEASLQQTLYDPLNPADRLDVLAGRLGTGANGSLAFETIAGARASR